MRRTNRSALGIRGVAVTIATAVVAFLCGWSADGLAAGVVLAAALGAAAGVAVVSETSGSHLSCGALWSRRRSPRQALLSVSCRRRIATWIRDGRLAVDATRRPCRPGPPRRP